MICWDENDRDETEGKRGREVIVAAIDFTACATELCEKCAAIKTCSTRAIVKIDVDEPAFIERALCHGCGDCVAACPHSAISLIDS